MSLVCLLCCTLSCDYPTFLQSNVTFTIISYCGYFLLVWLDLEPADLVNSKEYGHGRLMYAVVRQMRTDPLHLFLLICLSWIQMRRRSAICSSPSDVRERRGGRSGEEAWYPGRSSPLLCRPRGKQCSTLLSSAARDTEGEEVRREKRREREDGGGVQSWHTLLPSPRLLAGKLSDTTDYSSHYSQRLTSVSVHVCVCVCMDGLVSTVNCVNMHACLLLCDL